MSPTEKTDSRATPGGREPAAPARPAAAPGASVPAERPAAPRSASSAPRTPLSSTRAPVSPVVAATPVSSPGSSPGTGAGTGAGTGTSATVRPGPVATPAPPPAGEAPRRVRLSLSRVNLWSVARLAFLLSVALGIIAVVAVTALWAVLSSMGVFTNLDSVVRDVVGTESDFRVGDVFSLSRVLSVTVFLAVVDVVLVTLVTTIGALLYNLASGLVGGVRLTLSDD